MTENNDKPTPKLVALESLLAPSLRKEAAARNEVDFAKYLHNERLRRHARRWRRRQDRANAFGWWALGGIEPGDQDYAAWGEGKTIILIAEDEQGDILYPRDLRSGWYESFRWWKPLHWLALARTFSTKQVVMVEDE